MDEGARPMITKVKLHNFQCYGDATIKLSGGINIIGGDSDGGKSALFRSIRWVGRNEPKGDGFIKHGEKDCKVSIWKVLNDGSTAVISRERTSSSSGSYTIRHKKITTTFKALSGKVPTEVSQALDFGEYSLQGQFDKFFLLQDSAGEVARKLNKVVGLSSIDNHYTAITSKNLKLGEQLKIHDTNIEEATESLKDDCWDAETLEELEAFSARLKKLEVGKDEKLKLLESLKQSRDKLHGVKVKQTENTYKKGSIEAIEKIKELYTLQQEQKDQKTELTRLLGKIPDIDVAGALKHVSVLLATIKIQLEVSNERQELWESQLAYALLSKKIADKVEHIAESEEALSEYIAEIGACPLCGGDYEDCND